MEHSFESMTNQLNALTHLTDTSSTLVTDDDFDLAWAAWSQNGALFETLSFDHPMNKDLRTLRDKAFRAIKAQALRIKREQGTMPWGTMPALQFSSDIPADRARFGTWPVGQKMELTWGDGTAAVFMVTDVNGDVMTIEGGGCPGTQGRREVYSVRCDKGACEVYAS